MVEHNLNGKPSGTSHHGFRFSLRTLLIVVTLASILAGGWVWVNKEIDDGLVALLVGEPGPVHTQEKWPRVLKDLIAEATDENVDIEVMEVHCIQSGWDEEFVWRMKSSPGLLDFLKERLGLVQTDPPIWSIFVGNPRVVITDLQSPTWPLPELKESDYFASPSFMKREPSDRFEMVYDTKNDLFVVHYYYDF